MLVAVGLGQEGPKLGFHGKISACTTDKNAYSQMSYMSRATPASTYVQRQSFNYRVLLFVTPVYPPFRAQRAWKGRSQPVHLQVMQRPRGEWHMLHSMPFRSCAGPLRSTGSIRRSSPSRADKTKTEKQLIERTLSRGSDLNVQAKA